MIKYQKLVFLYFLKISVFFLDIDECTRGTHRCRHDEQCRNNEGSYTCVAGCPQGLTRAANGTCVGMYRGEGLLVERLYDLTIAEVIFYMIASKYGVMKNCLVQLY